ncbi:MAG: hypothetical protein R2761_18360 [Acidimicrobiales bacterium]
MLSLVLVTESEQTQRFITMLIVALLVFAGLLFLITLWYLRYTNPKRRVRRVLQPAGGGPEVDLRRRQYQAGDPRMATQGGYPAGQAGYDPRLQPGYDPRQQPGYDPRYASPRRGDGRYASPVGQDPYAYGQGDGPRRRLLQDDEHDPYQARRY